MPAEADAAPTRCAVLGSPVAHSLSPVMHRAAYVELGLDWTYDAVEVAEDDVERFVADLDPSWRGLSITAPLKRRAAALVDERSDDVAALGVANTVLLGHGRTAGHNTDVPGGVAALREAGLDDVRSARVLGGGATAASMALALARLGTTTLEVIVRDVSRAADVVQVGEAAGLEVKVRHLDRPMVKKVDLLVSTVPGGVIGARSHELVDGSRAVFDVVYDPWPSPLAAAAAESGVPVVSGLDLLAHQAALQVELMTTRTVSPQLLRDAALAALATR
jgi:shikimate dehydrogenase